MARLGRHRIRARIPQKRVAGLLGVHPDAVYKWETGARSPHYAHVVGYANHVGQQIILRDGPRILAEGVDIPAALPKLRKAAGLTPAQFALRLHIIPPAVTASERRGYQLLASYEASAQALGLTIDLQACRTARLVMSG
jgi:transcriptional regulator with XRE-family HTH domain